MTTETIRRLSKDLVDEAVKERNFINGLYTDDKIRRFILDEIISMGNKILCLTEEKHEFTYNFYHPDVLKKFPEKLNEYKVGE